VSSYLDAEGTIIPDINLVYKMTGTLMNPALAFGTQLISLDFTYCI
jgi:glycerol uptake facilitator-like aquaporin